MKKFKSIVMNVCGFAALPLSSTAVAASIGYRLGEALEALLGGIIEQKRQADGQGETGDQLQSRMAELSL